MQNLEIGEYRSFNIMHHKNTALVYIIKLKYPTFFILHHEKSINWQISSFYIRFLLCIMENMVFVFNEKVKYKKIHIVHHVKYGIVFVLNVSYQNF